MPAKPYHDDDLLVDDDDADQVDDDDEDLDLDDVDDEDIDVDDIDADDDGDEEEEDFEFEIDEGEDGNSWAIDQSDNVTSHNTSGSSRDKSFVSLNAEDLINQQQEQVIHVHEVLGVPLGISGNLLRAYQWNKEQYVYSYGWLCTFFSFCQYIFFYDYLMLIPDDNSYSQPYHYHHHHHHQQQQL